MKNNFENYVLLGSMLIGHFSLWKYTAQSKRLR